MSALAPSDCNPVGPAGNLGRDLQWPSMRLLTFAEERPLQVPAKSGTTPSADIHRAECKL